MFFTPHTPGVGRATHIPLHTSAQNTLLLTPLGMPSACPPLSHPPGHALPPPPQVLDPAVRDRLLRGPLGPEQLKSEHSMSEPDIARLYRVLYLYSVGFCHAVMDPLDRAHKRGVLVSSGGRGEGGGRRGGVWVGLGLWLWSECTGEEGCRIRVTAGV